MQTCRDEEGRGAVREGGARTILQQEDHRPRPLQGRRENGHRGGERHVVEGKVAQGREVAHCVVALVLREMLPPPPPPPNPRPSPPSPPRCAAVWGSPFDSP